eukprot:2948609-Rhodomonas_salina.1
MLLVNDDEEIPYLCWTTTARSPIKRSYSACRSSEMVYAELNDILISVETARKRLLAFMSLRRPSQCSSRMRPTMFLTQGMLHL